MIGAIIAVLLSVAAIGYALITGKKLEQRKNLKRRLKGMKEKQEIKEDVETRDDDDLIDGITRRK